MNPTRPRSSVGPIVSALLVVAFVVGSVLVSAVIVVRGRLLDAGTYTTALVTTDAFERVYTDVLADAELATLKEQLLGDLGLGPRSAVQVRALGTNVVRWTVPPSALHAGSDEVITSVLAYVRGDTDRLDADVAIDGVLDRIDSTAVTEAQTLLAAATDRTVTSIDAYRDAVAELVEQLAAGTVPDSIPVLGGKEFDPEAVIGAIMDALGPRADDEVRAQVLAAVSADDERNALITVAGAVAAEHGTSVADRLRAGAEDGQRLDLVDAIAERARRPASDVVASLDAMRDAARWFSPVTAVIGALLMAAAGAGLLWRHRRDPRRACLLLAAALGIAGAANIVLWWIATRAVAPPLGAATGTGPESWNLPEGLRTLLADVQRTVADELAGTVRRYSGVLAGVGAALWASTVFGPPLRALGPRTIAAAAGVVVVVIAVAGLVVGTGIGGASPRACNGHVELCDRRYDEVVYAATHNSMSSPDIVPVWPEHDGDLRAQLDAGVRALLIDSKYWPPVEAVGDLTAALDDTESPFPPALAERWYDTLGPVRDGRDGTFLCHIHCAFGAIPFLDAMVIVHDFLVSNPDDVVTLIIQDAVSTEDTVEVMREAGLEDLLVTHDIDEPWPTLDELIDRGQRLVVFAEEGHPPPVWYVNAFEAMQETPFLFLSPEELSCEPNRGVPGAPLFQMNHWIQRIAPDRVDAVRINRLDVLVDRARQCERERGLLPNYLAVNFYNIGDVVEAADALNGLR